MKDGQMVTVSALSYIQGSSTGLKTMPILFNKRYGPALDIGFAYLVSMPGLGNLCFSEALACTAIYQVEEVQDTLEDHIVSVKGILS